MNVSLLPQLLYLNKFLAATATDGFELNYRIAIVEDCCKGVDIDDILTTKKELINLGAIIINSKQVLEKTELRLILI